jgi:hypothetical protein
MVAVKHYRESKDEAAVTYSNLHEQAPPKVFLRDNEQILHILYSFSDSFLTRLTNFRIAVIINVVLGPN